VTQSVGDWVKTLPNIANFTISQGVFANQPSFILTSLDTTSTTSGSEYVVSYKGNMLVIWHKTMQGNDANTDDAKRLQGIVQSFTLQ
jgi:hypothetical protein